MIARDCNRSQVAPRRWPDVYKHVLITNGHWHSHGHFMLQGTAGREALLALHLRYVRDPLAPVEERQPHDQQFGEECLHALHQLHLLCPRGIRRVHYESRDGASARAFSEQPGAQPSIVDAVT